MVEVVEVAEVQALVLVLVPVPVLRKGPRLHSSRDILPVRKRVNNGTYCIVCTWYK